MADNNLNYEPVTTEPISEIGKELYALLGNEVELEEPISEIGKILYAMLGYEVEIPEPKSVIARLLYQYYLEGGGDIPEELITEMNAVLNKKLGTSTTYLPNTWADNVNLLGKLPTKTASGSIANFVDGADDVPIAEGVFNIVATQEGTGDPSPDNVRPISGFTGMSIYQRGANLFNWATKETGYKVVWTTGENYADASAVRSDYISVKQGANISTSTDVYMLGYDKNKNYLGVYNSGIKNFVKSTNGSTVRLFEIPSNCYFIKFLTFDPLTAISETFMSNYGTTATTYEPYNANVYNIDWTTEAGTVYGGSLNLTTGEGVSDVEKITSFTSVYKNSTDPDNYLYYVKDSRIDYSKNDKIICSHAPRLTQPPINQVGVFCTTQYGGICYFNFGDAIGENDIEHFLNYLYNTTDYLLPLATPQTFQLDPVEIRTLLGVNNIWTDTNGDSAIQYRADIDLIINS